jgi:prolyl-tRNA synthetase
LVLCDKCGYAANSEVASSRSKQDVQQISEGDQCLHCEGDLRITRGIEIGNIFQLGTKYTASMGMSYLDETGRAQIPLMGCYGIGVGRLMASVIEDSHDERGPIWPKSIAPYYVHLCVLDANDQAVAKRAEEVYEKLQRSGIEVLWDDTNAPVGVQFADADLIGAPVKLVISKRTEQRGVIEYSMRDGSSRGDLSIDDVFNVIR